EQQAFDLKLSATTSPAGQKRINLPIRVTTSRPLAYDPSAYLTTEVIRHYIVTTTADDGAGSLRDVITRANAECTRDGISCKAAFKLSSPVPATGWFTIRPRTPLPPINTALIVDATTQTGVTGDANPLGPEVELNGSDLTIGNGLLLHTYEIAGVRGLAINHFPENGIAIDQFSNGYYGLRRTIPDCYIGTDPTGRVAAPNGLRGISVTIDPKYSAGLNIFDNVISGNGRSGIFMPGGYDLHISSNRIGVAAGSEALPLGNGASGIYLGSSNNVLVDNNVIAFNHDVGVGRAISSQSIGVQRDALFANGTLGIDYGLDGVTPNDGSNRPPELPQFPLITSAVWDASAGVTRVRGIAPPSRYVSDRGSVDVYRNGG